MTAAQPVSSKDVQTAKPFSGAAWYRALFDHSHSGILLIDPQVGTILAANPAACGLLGCTEKELLSLDRTAVVDTTDPRLAAALEVREKTGQYRAELTFRRVDGTLFPVAVTSSNFAGPNGEEVAGVFFTDITTSKEAERDRAFLAAIAESTTDAIVGRTLDGRVTSWNGGAEKLFGFSAAEAIGQPLPLLAPPGWAEKMQAVMGQVVAGQTVPAVETECRTKDNRIVAVLVSSFPVLDSNGQVIGVSSIARDITERKRAELALASSEARLKAVIENTNDRIWSVDREYRLLVANAIFTRGIEAQIGRTLAPGESVLEVFPPEHSARWQALYDRALAGESFVFELPSQLRPGGTLECHFNPIRDGNGAVTGVVGRTTDITDRLQGQAQMQVTLRRLQLATDAAEIGVWDWNFADDSLNWDERLCEFYAVPAALRQSGLIYDFWRSRLHPADLAETEASLLAARMSGEPWQRVFRIVLPDGSIRFIQSASITECDGAGQPVRMIGINRDITRQQQLEEARRASEERLRLALEATNEGLWDWDIATGVVIGTDRWFQLFGYEPGEAPPTIHLWEDTLHPEDAPATLCALDDYLQGRTPAYHSEHRVITKSGAVRWHLSVGKVVAWDATGQPVRMVGTNADITSRKIAEQRVRDSEERFRLVVQNSPSIIAIRNADCELQYISPSVEQILGWPQAEVARREAAAMALTAGWHGPDFTLERLMAAGFTPEDAANWLQMAAAVGFCIEHPGEKLQVETRMHTIAGDYREMESVYLSVARGATDFNVVSITTDVTDHKLLARVLRDANALLEEQVAARTAELQATVAALRQANVGKDAFMAAISHELRTPLTGILGIGEVLQSQARGPLNPHQERYVQLIMESGHRLLETITDVLDYTSLLAGNLQLEYRQCRLADLGGYSIYAVQDKAQRKGQRIALDVAAVETEILSDANSITKVLTTLLDNAIKFTPENGKIGLEIAPSAEAAAVELVVWDTGIGMTADQVAQLFEPFVQGDLSRARRFEGLGLGLAYVHKLVELLGGRVTAESAPGQGSRFRVTLPVNAQVRPFTQDPAGAR